MLGLEKVGKISGKGLEKVWKFISKLRGNPAYDTCSTRQSKPNIVVFRRRCHASSRVNAGLFVFVVIIQFTNFGLSKSLSFQYVPH